MTRCSKYQDFFFRKNLRDFNPELDSGGNRVAKYVMDGQTEFAKHITFYVRDASGNVMVDINENDFVVEDRIDVVFTTTLGNRQYELSNHLGNVLSVIGDQKLPIFQSGVVESFEAYVISAQDYSPFGVTLDGRSWSNDEYRYGFNGKELDKEGMGGGASTYDYGFRIYNAALGKFLSVDPLSASYPWYTPYQFAGNKPIIAIDLDGLEEFIVILQPDPVDPLLTRIDISKVSEDTRKIDPDNPSLGINGVQYITLDSKGNQVSSTRLADFQPGSAEEFIMNQERTFYSTPEGAHDKEGNSIDNGTTMTNREGMNPTPNGNWKTAGSNDCSNNDNPEGGRASYTGQTVYQYNTNVLYNTDKANITKEDLQPGTYDLAISSINSLIKLLNNDRRFSTWDVVAIGCADRNPSNYLGPENQICGNPCLSQDRADGVADLIGPNVSQRVTTSTRVTTNSDVVSTDRSTNVAIVPNQK